MQDNTQAPRTIVNSAVRETYRADELKNTRIGADLHEQIPSRRGNRLYYRDGRVEEIKND